MIPCECPAIYLARMKSLRLDAKRAVKSSGCCGVCLMGMRMSCKAIIRDPANIYSGWETAVALQDSMVNYIIRELAALSPSSKISDATGLNIDQAITNAFVSLDRDIMDLGAKAASGPSYLNDAMSQLGPAYSGSCALVSYYHSDSRVLKVACVGDSRAVLGRRNVSGGWDATALSADQTGNNPQEVARLQREHPDEPRMLKAGRVLGLAVSRAFGDSRWKWTRDLQEQAYRRFFGPRIVEPLLTPPYLTAEPIITTTKIEPGKGDFVIMASDGLWERLTNEQAVELVGRWLEKHDPSRRVPPPNLAAPPTAWSKKHVSTRKNPDPYMAYADRQSADETHFVVADENAATHLARNALGGGDEDKLCGLLTPSPPYSRNLR